MNLKTFNWNFCKLSLGIILMLSVFSFQGFARKNSCYSAVNQTTLIVNRPREIRQTILFRVATSKVILIKSKSFFTAVPFVNLINFHNAQIQHFLFIQDLYKQVKIRPGFYDIRKTQNLNSEDSEILPLA